MHAFVYERIKDRAKYWCLRKWNIDIYIEMQRSDSKSDPEKLSCVFALCDHKWVWQWTFNNCLLKIDQISLYTTNLIVGFYSWGLKNSNVLK